MVLHVSARKARRVWAKGYTKVSRLRWMVARERTTVPTWDARSARLSVWCSSERYTLSRLSQHVFRAVVLGEQAVDVRRAVTSDVSDEERYQVGRDVVQKRVRHVQVWAHALAVGGKRVLNRIEVKQLRWTLQVVQRLRPGTSCQSARAGFHATLPTTGTHRIRKHGAELMHPAAKRRAKG